MAKKYIFTGNYDWRTGGSDGGFQWVDESKVDRGQLTPEAQVQIKISENAGRGGVEDPIVQMGLLSTTPAAVVDEDVRDEDVRDEDIGDEPWMPQTLAGDTAARPSPGDYVPSVRGANAAQIRAGNVFPGTNIPLSAIPAGQRQQYIDRLNADLAEDPTGRRANDVIFDIAFAASTQAQRDAGGQGSPHIGAVQSGMWKLDEGPLWPEMNINSTNDRYFIRDPNTGVRTGDIVRYDEDSGVVRGQQEEGTGRFIGSDYLRHFGTNEAAGILEGMPTLFPPEGTRPYGVMDDTGGLLGASGGTFGTGTASPYYAQDYSIPHMETGGLWEGLGAEYQPGTVEGLGLLAGEPSAPYEPLARSILDAQPAYTPTGGIFKEMHGNLGGDFIGFPNPKGSTDTKTNTNNTTNTTFYWDYTPGAGDYGGDWTWTVKNA